MFSSNSQTQNPSPFTPHLSPFTLHPSPFIHSIFIIFTAQKNNASRKKQNSMKKTKFILALILLNIVLISCSSDDSSDPDPEPSSKLVKTEKISDTEKVDYTYNTDNLLATYNGLRTDFSYSSNFIYNSEKQLTEWSQEETGSGGSSTVTTFTYDAEGRLSGYSFNNSEVFITYDGSTVTATGTIAGDANAEAQMELNGAGLITKFTESNQYTIFTYDSKGNMATAKSFDNADNPLLEFTIAYDDKVNPFYGQFESLYIERFLEFFWEFDGIYHSGYEGYAFPFHKNNITVIQEVGGDALTYTYTYDADGYPTAVNEDDMGSPFIYSISYH